MAVEDKIAELEGGIGAMCTMSGQAAVLLSLLNICNAGDSFISTTEIYGGSVNLFSHTLRRLGIECIILIKMQQMKINFIILRLEGNIGVAAFGVIVITVISLVVVAMYTGLSQGIQPIISLNHGRKNVSNIKAVLKYAMAAMLLLSGVIYTVIYFGASQLTFIFNSEKNEMLQQFAVAGLKLYFLACPFIGFNIVTATYFTSTECPRPAQIISFLRGLFILVPMAFLLSSLYKMTGVWCAYPLTECIVTLIGMVFYICRCIKDR